MKNISKLLLAISSFAFVGASLSLSGCSSDNTDSSVIKNDAFVKLGYTNLDLTVGESVLLGVNISGGTVDTELVFKVEDERIASVTNGGLVTALDFGKTEIRAIYGNSVAKCSVNVTLGDNIPVISIQNIEEKNIKIDISSKIELNPIITYDNQIYEFTPTYVLSDSDVGEMNGNTFIPKSNGIEYITIKGEFHGIQAISTTLEILIQDNVIIYMKDENNIEQNEVMLYSHEGFGEETFKTSFKPTFGVFVNDQEIVEPDLEIEFVNDDGALIYDSVTHEIRSTLNVGQAYYEIKFIDDDKNEYFKTFNVYNNKSLFTYKGAVIETDSFNGVLPLDDIFASFTDRNIDMVTNIDGSVTYDVEDNVIKGLPVLTDTFGNVVDQQFIIYNQSVGYKVSLRVFTKIISKISDFDYFNLKTFDDKFYGYYVVSNDIDGAGYVLKPHVRTMGNSYLSYPNAGLLGTFDGRGHTIKNVSIGEGGLFGNVGRGGTIKNVGFKDIIIRNPSAAGGDDTPIIASYVNGAIFSNVYISNPYIKAGFNAGLIACNIMNNCLFTNCMFECFMENETDIVSKNFGIFGSMCGEKNSLPDGFANVYKDVVVNSNLPLVKSATNLNAGVSPYIIDTYAIALEGFTSYLLNSGIIRFTSEEAMSQSSETFDNFSPSFWEVNNNVLVWKSAK